MYLSNIKLWNFRKFGSSDESDYQTNPHLDLNLPKGLNVIIGENDSGKTAIIDAVKLVLKTHSYDYIRVDDKDFYKESNRFRIELKFEDLTLVPYDKNLINKKLLSKVEIGYLNTYHKEVFEKLNSFLNLNELIFLKKICSPL